MNKSFDYSEISSNCIFFVIYLYVYASVRVYSSICTRRNKKIEMVKYIEKFISKSKEICSQCFLKNKKKYIPVDEKINDLLTIWGEGRVDVRQLFLEGSV